MASHFEIATDGRLKSLPTCQLESRRYVTPAFQPAGNDTFLCRVPDIAMARRREILIAPAGNYVSSPHRVGT